jgi:hypothetical protein
LRLKKENGEVEHGKAIIHAEFGQVGSKDEEKIVVIREVLRTVCEVRKRQRFGISFEDISFDSIKFSDLERD